MGPEAIVEGASSVMGTGIAPAPVTTTTAWFGRFDPVGAGAGAYLEESPVVPDRLEVSSP